MIDLGADAATARATQKSAAAAHESQSQALPPLVRRLDLLDGREPLRWLVSPQRTAQRDDESWAIAGSCDPSGGEGRRPAMEFV